MALSDDEETAVALPTSKMIVVSDRFELVNFDEMAARFHLI